MFKYTFYVSSALILISKPRILGFMPIFSWSSNQKIIIYVHVSWQITPTVQVLLYLKLPILPQCTYFMDFEPKNAYLT